MKRYDKLNFFPALGLIMVSGICLEPGAVSADQNWPQWRGPHQDGSAPQADPPTTWDETKNIKWKVKIPGEGSATPIVWENKIFIQTAIATGKKVEAAAAASSDQNTNRPPEPGGGRGGFGPGLVLGERMLKDGDKDKDEKLSRAEFTGVADSWFNKLDTAKTGKLDQDQFSERFSNVMGPPPEGAPGGGGRRGGSGRFASGLFGAADANKDGNLTADEFRSTFDKWFTQWDTEKTGMLDGSKLRDGLNGVLPRPQFGAGGPGGPGGRRGGGGAKPAEVQQFTLICLDRQTGKVLWQQIAREEVPHEGFREGDGNFASPSGLTDGKHVFAYFGSHGLYCYDLSGKRQWSKDLGKMRIAMGFGEGSSPAMYKDSLFVNRDHEDGSFLVALDKNTGQEIWRQARDERTSWATPLVVEHDGKAELVLAATGKIRSYDPGSGKLIWECGGLTRNVIPSPVADSEKVYCMSGFQGNSLLAIKLGRTGDLTDSDAIAWKRNKSTSYVPSSLLYEGKLYFFASNNGRLSCVDTKSGDTLMDAETVSDIPNVYASPLGAAGRVYLVGRNGVTVVLKNTGKLDQVAVNKLNDKIDASPVAVGKDLLLRGRENVYCISEK